MRQPMSRVQCSETSSPTQRPNVAASSVPLLQIAACTSGGLQCTYDEKRACDMCLCKHEVM